MKLLSEPKRIEQTTRRLHRMLTRRAFVAAALTLSFIAPQATYAAAMGCSDTQLALQYWRPIKEQIATSNAAASELSLELISCLGSPNAELRDEIAYELFTYWLRNDALSHETRLLMLSELSERMNDTRIESSLSRSFSALILAELMRADGQTSFMSEAQRGALLESTIAAIKNEYDYRGLDDEIGWVHPVAHMSDLLWRFALHPETNSRQAHQILNGVEARVAPTETSYRFNESDRLARVVSTLIQRANITDDEADLWLEQFATPKSLEAWSDAFRSSADMAELHNTKQFLRALSDQLESTDVGEKTREKLHMLVQGFTQLI